MVARPISAIAIPIISILLVLPCVSHGQVPEPANVPATLPVQEHAALLQLRSDLLGEKVSLEQEIKEQQSQCGHINVKDTEKVASCTAWHARLKDRYAKYIDALHGFKANVDKKSKAAGTDSFYASRTDTFLPMKVGHPLDAPGAPPVGLHGLVGGTTWTYGFLRPQAKCDEKCKATIQSKLHEQLVLYCKSQENPEKCITQGLPFTPDSYDMVLSMASYHSAIEDLALRVVWDGQSFGEFSRHHAAIFNSLTGRKFDTLDCHSNGAMLCLAALRNPETKTTAKKVRLFGPQINSQAAELWREWMKKNPGSTIEIYINNGDPVPTLSWKLPAPQTTLGKSATAAWLTNPLGGPAVLADALVDTWLDSKFGIMDKTLDGYGFKVTRFHISEKEFPGIKCDSPDLDCHSMILYEKKAGIFPVKH